MKLQQRYWLQFYRKDNKHYRTSTSFLAQYSWMFSSIPEGFVDSQIRALDAPLPLEQHNGDPIYVLASNTIYDSAIEAERAHNISHNRFLRAAMAAEEGNIEYKAQRLGMLVTCYAFKTLPSGARIWRTEAECKALCDALKVDKPEPVVRTKEEKNALRREYERRKRELKATHASL